MNSIFLHNINKSYNNKKVIDNFNLTINDKQFVVFLGPSGCGKSTLLRIIAGLEDIDSGEIWLDNTNITKKEPKDRDVSMVFQNYALYPHMTVYRNIAINLELKKIPKETIKNKVMEIAKILHIEDLLDRKPRQLSGGQMQRVALARAMIKEPKIFLMDEPLSNLDTKLRVQTRAEIIKLYNRLQTTTIYVTHDQIEAMTMADTIVLMKDGKIEQQGSPEELYNKPQTLFTAQFIGSPQINTINCEVNNKSITLFEKTIPVPINTNKIIAALRAEDLKIIPGDNFKVEIIENLGNEKLVYLIDKDNNSIAVRTDVNSLIKQNDKVNVDFNSEKIHLFDAVSKLRLN